jgi:hypothetical protein
VKPEEIEEIKKEKKKKRSSISHLAVDAKGDVLLSKARWERQQNKQKHGPS